MNDWHFKSSHFRHRFYNPRRKKSSGVKSRLLWAQSTWTTAPIHRSENLSLSASCNRKTEMRRCTFLLPNYVNVFPIQFFQLVEKHTVVTFINKYFALYCAFYKTNNISPVTWSSINPHQTFTFEEPSTLIVHLVIETPRFYSYVDMQHHSCEMLLSVNKTRFKLVSSSVLFQLQTRRVQNVWLV